MSKESFSNLVIVLLGIGTVSTYLFDHNITRIVCLSILAFIVGMYLMRAYIARRRKW